ncbi:MAG: class I SAM-dependent methyltransferase [Acidimicrobiales bacterium]
MLISMLKRLAPPTVRRLAGRLRGQGLVGLFHERSNAEIFARAYRRNVWGKGNQPYYSGLGSHDARLVDPYISAVRVFLTAQPNPLDAVDLGCGDFSVGRQLRPLCGRYVACDIVPNLINWLRTQADLSDVDFQVLDIVKEALPTGDVVFLRQVLQHLSNAHISAVLSKLREFRFVIVTEHVPLGVFTANVDLSSGIDVRSNFGSGVELGETPFLFAQQAHVICRVPLDASELVTTLYRQTEAAGVSGSRDLS